MFGFGVGAHGIVCCVLCVFVMCVLWGGLCRRVFSLDLREGSFGDECEEILPIDSHSAVTYI